MRSFGILRTNVGLTTNIKIMVDSSNGMHLESINSDFNLSMNRLKKVSFNKSNYYDELIPYFWKGLPEEIAFKVADGTGNETMSDDFANQYDELYNYGARNILNNKSYDEEFEYFAPFYIGSELPKGFIIFRVDGPGIGLTTKENFRTDILEKFKCVKIFDLTKSTPIGEWIDKSFYNNEFFPKTPLEIDFKSMEFSKWNGIDYKTGGWASKSFFLDDIFEKEMEIYELDKFISDNWKSNSVVFPNILNMSFLYDDEPSTPDVKRKWSINRYFGFYYEDIIEVTSISPYITPIIRQDSSILEGNIFWSSSNGNPFLSDWSDNRPFYIEYLGQYYPVEKFKESQGVSIQSVKGADGVIREEWTEVIIDRWRIISDIDLEGKESDINKNFGIIDSNNKLIGYHANYIDINGFDDCDIWLIEINGIYHNLIRDTDNSIRVITDYSFNFIENSYEYSIGGQKTSVNFTVDFNNIPKKFKIFKVSLNDIKDFDTRILDTDYSKFEYELENELTHTDESKLYVDNLSSKNNPKELHDLIWKDVVSYIPVSSEYTAGYETFKIENNNLTKIWSINSQYTRWSYQNSLGSGDIPYVLNNSKFFEDWNRGVNTIDASPKRLDRNLDYFYTINSSTSSYIHHSLHVEDHNITNYKFEIDKYINSGTYSDDYFTTFFNKKSEFLNSSIKRNTKKYSQFNSGDSVIPNISLFKGIEFRIYDVDSIVLNSSNAIDIVNLSTSNGFDDYKLSILLSDNDLTIDSNGSLTQSSNNMSWNIISEWSMDKNWKTGDIVHWNDILYYATSDNITESPTTTVLSKSVPSAPYNLSSWNLYITTPTKLWNPNTVYSSGIVYNSENWYYYNGGTDDIWNPILANSTGYTINDIVLFDDRYFISLTSSNPYEPSNTQYWASTTSNNQKWSQIPVWNPGQTYQSVVYAIHNDVVWTATSLPISIGEEPGISNKWTREYSFRPDTDYVYTPLNNNLIFMNGRYYMINSNSNNSTLDNGIIIYINKKWKNILININISDNTLPNISGVDRDTLYTDLYKKLTANNFIKSINDIDNKGDFTDYVSYVIIEEDGSISKYNYSNNITDLKYMVKCEFPDEIEVGIKSLLLMPIDMPKELKANKVLVDGKIKDISELNYYDNIPPACEISENTADVKIFKNYSGNKNITTDKIWRFSGYYMPLFIDIELFDRYNTNNYKFDESLTNFGIIKERKIRKINREGSQLKLKSSTGTKSIYPMVDEFGLTTIDFFIFKSSWDYQYHVETKASYKSTIIDTVVSVPTGVSKNIGKSKNNNDQNYNL